jgi:FAD/FMN-containing dehydrogenase
MPSLSSAAADLRKVYAGELLEPGAAGYDVARRVHNGIIDKRPALIARCRGTADIADAIRIAHGHKLDVSIRGGGHNVAGRATIEGGLMIDLSLMRHVRVDPASRVAWVGGGALWRDVNRETQQFGLATTGGVVSSTGVAGLTLGGGFGWLMPRFGLALDNLRSVTLVLADGTVERVSASHSADVFWAVRGGGGNFGVAAEFEFELHEVGPMVTGGLVAHAGARAKEVLRFFRDQTDEAPDEVFLVAALAVAPEGSGAKIAAVAAQHSGSLPDGEAFARPIKAFGSPLIDMLGPLPYVVSNMLFDEGMPQGARNYWKSHFLMELSDAAMDALTDAFDRLPTGASQILVEHFHGAGTRVPVADTAYALRHPGFNVLFLAQWQDPKDDHRCVAWAREAYASIEPFVSPLRYGNYLSDDDLSDATNLSKVYGPNLPRLRKIKKDSDPGNLFRLNLNIPPAD